MALAAGYAAIEPGADEVAATPGRVALEFGAPWCSHCQAAQPAIAQALQARPDAAHLKIEDGKGRPLGRAYRVKLWPTLVLLRDGEEVARVVRPRSPADLADALARWDAAAG
ncbi:thioredoxin family protein [Stenotrophomonas sp. HITSZ_GD]|uniref:thioredoxin family protein n=1 Tax=Stenotrophomonas sp. HITSZ_GD TaxID=3037248 RepID=UPI00240D928E|nr:thioredoxin family protein [Stenotrophomonas sp. HITSZ_GD]MDG2524029.1 thioredoxin family protein [Stenotrophomonas sp. HITSZ_GD]